MAHAGTRGRLAVARVALRHAPELLGTVAALRAERDALVDWLRAQPGLVAAQVRTGDQVRTIHLMLHLYGPQRCFERLEPVFRERGIQRDGQIGAAHVRLVDARRMVEIARQALLQDPAILLA